MVPHWRRARLSGACDFEATLARPEGGIRRARQPCGFMPRNVAGRPKCTRRGGRRDKPDHRRCKSVVLTRPFGADKAGEFDRRPHRPADGGATVTFPSTSRRSSAHTVADRTSQTATLTRERREPSPLTSTSSAAVPSTTPAMPAAMKSTTHDDDAEHHEPIGELGHAQQIGQAKKTSVADDGPRAAEGRTISTRAARLNPASACRRKGRS